MIDGADAKAFVGDEPVLAVEVQDVKPLDFTSGLPFHRSSEAPIVHTATGGR
jgi:hypothetical protein